MKGTNPTILAMFDKNDRRILCLEKNVEDINANVKFILDELDKLQV